MKSLIQRIAIYASEGEGRAAKEQTIDEKKLPKRGASKDY